MARFQPALAAASACALLAAAARAQSVPDDTPENPAVSAATIADEAGLTALVERLGGAPPTGAGGIVAMAAATSSAVCASTSADDEALAAKASAMLVRDDEYALASRSSRAPSNCV